MSEREGTIVAITKWLEIWHVGDKPKTKIFQVFAADGHVSLGYVKWFGRWRCYIFSPAPECYFEKDCLRDIADFCDQQTKIQRGSWKK